MGKKKNILVTGGAGFIGSHLCEALIKEGHSVVAVDNFDPTSPLYPRAQKEQNLEWLTQQKDFTLIEADVRDRKRMDELFSTHAFDHVYHLAGRGGIRHSKDDPFFYVDDIIVGTLVVLECAAKNGVTSLINASSSSVYGQTTGEKSKETDDTDKSGSVYAASKKASELLCHAYHALYGMGIVNVRFFSVYGPRGRHDMIIYKFARMIEEGKPIPDFRPDPKRDFTYVSDIVDGLMAMLQLPPSSYEVMNLGGGRPIAVTDSIKLLEEALGKKAVMGEVVETPASDMAVTNADSTRARTLLHWEPKVKLEEGVLKFVEWYKNTHQFTFD